MRIELPTPEELERQRIKAELFTLVDAHWKPVRKERMGEGAQTMTTERLFEVIEKHAPERFTASLLSTVLDDGQYETVRIGNELRWLVMPR
jgi:hypothetical protein